ncbi:alpha/beta hydrolase [Ideonella sp. DXS22W]|uniref:Alpha/beta hydrolase n=1 Tax=Pseudaquabacterium inlustre TaxID=2984192 RepID=A0ABU9CMP8_9BURK
MSTQFIDGLAVEIDGQGPDLVCIHGLGGSSNTWTPLFPALAGHRVVRIDLPGSARSAALAGGPGSLDIDAMVDAVAQACQRLDITRAVFLGHSMGTIVCQHLAARQPGLVSRLALFGPLVCPPDAARPNVQARADKAAAGGAAAMQEIADAVVQGATARHARETQPLAVALVRESLMRQDPLGYARSCEALARAQSAVLENIAVPVLLVTGDEDGVAPPAAVQAMASRLRDARMVVLPQCGHWTPLECAMQCQALLRDFLPAP